MLFGLVALTSYFLLRPRRGWIPRLARVLRMTERVRLEDALKHLQHCESMGLPCTTESVAGALEVSKARALRYLGRLDRMNLARADGIGHRLTEPGRRYALRLLRTHRLLERYFADRTGLPAQEWHEEAERQEHRLSVDQTERLAARMGHPAFDPHGDPIPTPTGALPPSLGIPLTEVPRGSVVRIVHLEDEPREVYDRIVARGFSPGMMLRVVALTPSTLTILAEGREQTLESVLAANVEVVAEDAVESLDAPQPTLAGLPVGEVAEVVGIAPSCQGLQRRRLLDLGVVPGTLVRATLASASGDPVAYEIRGAAIALRRAQAELIRIRSAPDGNGAAA